jgi:hypothetical protein
MKFDNFTQNMLVETDEKTPVIDLPRNTLDPVVFQFLDGDRLPILRDGIRAQVLHTVEQLSEVIPIRYFYITGQVLTKSWHENCDIDIQVETDAELMDNLAVAEIMYNLRRLDGQLAVGSTHKIRYHIHPGEVDQDEYQAIYDVSREMWIKTPEPMNPDVSAFVTRFNETLHSIDVTDGKIHNNTVNFKEIKRLGEDNIKIIRFQLQVVLDQISSDLNYMSSIYNDPEIQRLANDHHIAPAEVKHYGKKNFFPENVTFKLYQKMYTQKFIKQLDDIEDGTDEYDITQLIKQSRIGRAFWKA